MFISEIKNILDTNTLSKVFNIIREAKFVDGRISGGSPVRERGFRVLPVAISEFEKAEGGLTCLSLIFKT